MSLTKKVIAVSVMALSMSVCSSVFCASYHNNCHNNYIVYQGSLKDNIERIAKENGWHKVVWNVSYDYSWVTTMPIKSNNLIGAFNMILKNYPVKAIFYKGNKVIEITPRTIK